MDKLTLLLIVLFTAAKSREKNLQYGTFCLSVLAVRVIIRTLWTQTKDICLYIYKVNLFFSIIISYNALKMTTGHVT